MQPVIDNWNVWKLSKAYWWNFITWPK